MTATTWVAKDVVLAIHDAQLAEHGGVPGVRDEGLLDSALARSRNLAAYGSPDLCDLAAAYAYGVARDHPFVDGNKRTSFVTTALLLVLNHHPLVATDVEKITVWLALAAGEWDEPSLAAWLRRRIRAEQT